MSFFLPSGNGDENGEGERIFDWAVAEGLKILSMKRRKLSLEDIFVRLTETQQPSETPRPDETRRPADGETRAESAKEDKA
jgi:ABC-2 type transport system ATP-binding protein